MTLPALKAGDILTIDDEEMLITSHFPPNYWLQNHDTSSYYYMSLRSQEELQALFDAGRLSFGRKANASKGGNANHWHTWKRYTGLNKVIDYCECGAEKPLDWKELGKDNVTKNR